MYNVKHPKIVRAYVVSYDQDTNIMYYEIKETYDSEEELARYLARFHKPVYNIWGNIIPNVYTNIYMDFQALNGITYSEFPFYSETNLNRLKFSHNKYICRHIFFYLINAQKTPSDENIYFKYMKVGWGWMCYEL